MTSKCYRSEYVGLLGNPVDENPTVIIMEAGFNELGLNFRYNTMKVTSENLGSAIKALQVLNYKGSHITIPHKQKVIQHLDIISTEAELIGAVNTIYFRDGKVYGENTDGKGFLYSLIDNNIDIKNKNILILGAGGAARAISVELALVGVHKISIVNVHENYGIELVNLLNNKININAEYIPWKGKVNIPEETDIIIQATNVGLFPDTNFPNINYNSLKSHMIVCDIIPNPPITDFIKFSQARKCKTFNGLDMLVKQSCISFEIWTGFKAPEKIMRDAILKEFSNEYYNNLKV